MALVKKYRCAVDRILEAAPGLFTVSFRSCDSQFRYAPGQFLHLALDPYDPSSPWPQSRCFSIQSNEQDETITITFSIRGTFTARMAAELVPGKEVWLKLPYGSLFSSAHKRDNVVFVAGGTGITPFLSLFTSARFRDYQSPVLCLGVRSRNFHIYDEALQRSCAINPSFQHRIVVEDCDGPLQINKIFSAHGADTTWFISGPPAMILSFRKYLDEQGVDPAHIHTDDWE